MPREKSPLDQWLSGRNYDKCPHKAKLVLIMKISNLNDLGIINVYQINILEILYHDIEWLEYFFFLISIYHMPDFTIAKGLRKGVTVSEIGGENCAKCHY